MAILGPFDFTGGFSPGYDFIVAPPNTATLMRNCRIKSGYVAPRWSHTIMNGTPASFGDIVKGLTVWNDTILGKISVIATDGSGNKLWSSADVTSFAPGNGSTYVFTDRTGALAAASVSGLTTFDVLNNILVGSSNSASSGAVFKMTAYTSNGAALGGSPPSGDIVKRVNNFMFISRNLSSTATQSNVYWSNVNDPETWTAANVLAFNKNDGEPIMALGSIGTDLYIFKQSSIGRLSTVTITVSGAVTLGPLVTVIKGVGCCGPRALDNLPNGNIVFVGFDGHFYEFDGSTILDLCDRPYPGSNVYNSGRYSLTADYYMGLQGNLINTTINVKTVKGLREVWIAYTSSLHSEGYQTFAYNYDTGTWQGQIDVKAASMAILPFASVSHNNESMESVLMGTSSYAISYSGSSLKSYPTTNANPPVDVIFNIGTTVRLVNGEGATFIPRSLCFECTTQSQPQNSGLLYIKVYIGSDAYAGGTAIYTSTLSSPNLGQPVRNIIPLSFNQDSVGTNIFPTFLSIIFEGIGTGGGAITSGENPEIIRLGKFWISDEAMR